MKSLATYLLVTLALAGSAWAQNATTTPRPTLYMGQDKTTGDEIMSIGPDQGKAAPSSSPQELIITPEILLPPQNQDHPRNKGPKTRIKKPSNGPRTLETRP
jgi:hypothetical protein